MLKYLKILILTMVLTISCEKLEDKQVSDIGTLLKNSINMENYIEKVEEIRLEEGNDAVLSWPYNLVLIDNRIVISSRGCSIKVFDIKGKFLRNIGRIGDGPGEYHSLPNLIQISNEILGVYDSENMTISFFSMNGKFISSKRLNLKGSGVYRSIQYFNGNYYFEIPYSKQVPYHIAVLDSNMDIKKYLIPANPQYAGYSDRMMFRGGMYINKTNGLLYEVNSFSDNNINIVDLKTGVENKTKIKGVNFYIEKPKREVSADYETMSKLFYSGCDLSNVSIIDDVYFLSYGVPANNHSIKVDILYNPSNMKHKIISKLPFDYFDGECFYQLYFNNKNSKNPSAEKPVLKKITYKMQDIKKLLS